MPEPHQTELARAWVEAGADLVVGSPPHVLQGVERLDDASVLYSTGNFAFPSAREESSYTATFRFDVSERDVGLVATPVRIVDGRPVVAEDSRAGILEDLTARSFGQAFGADGVAHPTDEPGGCYPAAAIRAGRWSWLPGAPASSSRSPVTCPGRACEGDLVGGRAGAAEPPVGPPLTTTRGSPTGPAQVNRSPALSPRVRR